MREADKLWCVDKEDEGDVVTIVVVNITIVV